MSVRMYLNLLLLSSHDLPRMLWKASGESRGGIWRRESAGGGVLRQLGAPDALT